MKTLPLGLTFDDVLLVPQLSEVSPSTAITTTKLTPNIQLSIPLLSAAMDTVTGANMAIAIARLGGLGVLHRNCTIPEQVAMVRTVKKAGCLVAAAIGPHDSERALALDAVGIDAIVVDSAHVHKPSILKDVKTLRKKVHANLIVGNIATAAAARAFAPYVDALKVGVGPGAICTTRVVAGVGVPQLTAIILVAEAVKGNRITVIADGGIRYSGDIVKAIAGGAAAVMLGSLFAGTDEAPGDTTLLNGKKVKRYRGMGSLGAMQIGESSDRYGQKGMKKYVPEGVEGIVPYKGPLADTVYQLIGGLKAGMGYVGVSTIPQLMQCSKHFIRITPAGRAESHPHTIQIEKQAPNYN
ncbi:MAG: IMP dehydrogenase [Patescibacteria group bacterium]|jgi:IMP dehydrogenase